MHRNALKLKHFVYIITIIKNISKKFSKKHNFCKKRVKRHINMNYER